MRNRSRLWRIGTGVFCGLLAAAALPAQVGPNVKMNGPQTPMPEGRLGRPAEAIVGDPTGKYLVAAWETLHGTCGGSFGGQCTPPKVPGITATGYSNDGGKTWVDMGAPFLGGDIMTSGRPWLDRGGKDGQTFFLTSRAAKAQPVPVNQDGTPGGSNQIGLVLYRGRFDKNGVFSWTDQHLFTPRRPDLDLLRSPSIVAAKDGSGKVYMPFSTLLGICGRRGSSGGQIEFTASEDEGKTWSEPVIIGPDEVLVTEDPNDPKCGSAGPIQILPAAAIGPNGEIYVTWQHGPKLVDITTFKLDNKTRIRFVRSTDGGKTFTRPMDLVEVNSMRENSPVGYSKSTMNDIARIAVDTEGPHKGRIYVTYTTAVEPSPSNDIDQLLTSSQVYSIHSDDQGTTWSQPVALGPEIPAKGVKRFWPTVTVRDDGKVDVIYMESLEKQTTRDPGDIECNIKMVVNRTRAGRASSLIDVYWVQSKDGGVTFGPPVKVTSETTNWCNVKYDWETTQFANFGDILGTYTTGDRTFAVWPDGREGVPDAYMAELGDYDKAVADAKAAAEAAAAKAAEEKAKAANQGGMKPPGM